MMICWKSCKLMRLASLSVRLRLSGMMGTISGGNHLLQPSRW